MPYKITVFPSGKTVEAAETESLLEAGRAAGAASEAPCGGRGTCGKCRARVLRGKVKCAIPPDSNGYIRACLAYPQSDLEIEFPHVESAPERCRPASAKHVARAGIAFDLGTTTAAGILYDLNGFGERASVLAETSAANMQSAFGADVISRIDAACRGSASELRRAAADTMNAVAASLLGKSGVNAEDVSEVVIAGNTAMQQLFLGIDCSGLVQLPFEEAFKTAPAGLTAGRVGLSVNPEARVFVFPQIGGFVGGDTVAGILALSLDKPGRKSLLVDIGTNGEMALAFDTDRGRHILCASAAAGPAFEGAGIECGMRAGTGAICKVSYTAGGDNPEFSCEVIDGAAPRGICGSGLMDAVAALRESGLIDENGTMAVKCGGKVYLSEFVYITQKDIREFQLAKAAIRAGTEILLGEAGLKADELDDVFIAGAFGNALNPVSAAATGILPEVRKGATVYAGNTASAGASKALISGDEKTRANEIALKSEHICLSSSSGFQDLFSCAMLFPPVS